MSLAYNNHPVFVIDAMLGNIAKKLRLFGFDTKYESNISDDLLIKEVLQQKRILVTKDRQLYHRLKSKGVLVILPSRIDETGILIELLKGCQIKHIDLLPNSFTRCVLCNGSLHTVNKNSVIKEIPYNVFDHIDTAYRCTNCLKVYWNGTHISHINILVEEINYNLKV